MKILIETDKIPRFTIVTPEGKPTVNIRTTWLTKLTMNDFLELVRTGNLKPIQ